MLFRPRTSLELVRPLVLCLFAFLGWAGSCAAEVPALRSSGALAELIEELDLWLDQHSGLPRKPASAQIRWIDARAPAAVLRARPAVSLGKSRGFYDPDNRTIWLVRPWSRGNPRDVSVLLHELMHHRQHGAHWYCPGAQEHSAYRLQEAWLAERGLKLRVNWIAVVLESGCAARDIHPD